MERQIHTDRLIKEGQPCPSVHWLAGPSVRPSVHPSVCKSDDNNIFERNEMYEGATIRKELLQATTRTLMVTSSGHQWLGQSSGKAAEKQRKNSGKATEKQQKSSSRCPVLLDPVLTSPTSAFHHGSIGSGDGSGWSGRSGRRWCRWSDSVMHSSTHSFVNHIPLERHSSVNDIHKL